MIKNYRGNHDFRCSHCHAYITSDSSFSGVNNRNHCPYCLWSRHVDLVKAGDRLSACRAPMQPVGLCLKKSQKKYGSQMHGELMIIHHCTDCGRSSINRIAADDDTGRLFEVFQYSLHLNENLLKSLKDQEIFPPGIKDLDLINLRLYGKGCSLNNRIAEDIYFKEILDNREGIFGT